MGQYHTVYNKTKKEKLVPHEMRDGAKLLEFKGSNISMGLMLLLCNSNGLGGGDLCAPKKIEW